MSRVKTRRLFLERFEDRTCPAPYNISMSAGDVTITGTTTGTLNLVTDQANRFDISDTGGTVINDLLVGRNLTVNLNGANDAVILNTAVGGFTGDFTLNAGSGNDTFDLDPTSVVGGNMTLNGVNSANIIQATVGGNFRLTPNENIPNALILTGSQVGGNLTVVGGNDAVVGDNTLVASTTIGGSASVNLANGANQFQFGNGSAVSTSLTYTGGSAVDALTLSDLTVGTTLYANLGFSFPGANSFALDGATIGGGLTVLGGAGDDTIAVAVGGAVSIGGSASFNLSGGANDLDFLGSFGSSNAGFTYNGGAGVDNITYNPAADSSRVRFNAYLFAGDDVVNFVTAATNPSFAYVDFGAGSDTVMGTLNFPFTFLNLP